MDRKRLEDLKQSLVKPTRIEKAFLVASGLKNKRLDELADKRLISKHSAEKIKGMITSSDFQWLMRRKIGAKKKEKR